jgi:hypothetical protein
MRFQVSTAVSMNMTAFWDIASCSLILKIEAVNTSETSANFHECTRRNISEDCRLNKRSVRYEDQRTLQMRIESIPASNLIVIHFEFCLCYV